MQQDETKADILEKDVDDVIDCLAVAFSQVMWGKLTDKLVTFKIYR